MRVTGVSQEAEVACVRRESDQAAGVGRGGGDDVDHLHVSDVVDVEGLLQTHNQPRSVELDCEDGVAVAVLAYLSS